jgi:hypothetical protein
LEEALLILKSAERDLQLLKMDMGVVVDHWGGMYMELADMDHRVKALQTDHGSRWMIRGLNRDWDLVAKAHKSYVQDVRAVHA